jgi:hypothetical protein
MVLLAAAVGCVGGIYGIGGGSILAPILIGAGRRPADVALAALASTFVTSVAGVATFTILSLRQYGSVAPDWATGLALGAGGLAAATPGPASSPGFPTCSSGGWWAAWWSPSALATCGRDWADLALPGRGSRRPRPG